MPTEEEGERERRLEMLRRDFMPSDVSANWIRIRRRMETKTIRRRWRQEARERRNRLRQR